MSHKFHGTIEELKKIVSSTGISGEWQVDGAGKHTFRSREESVLNWWPSKGTVQFQGKPEGKAILEQSVGKLLDKVKGITKPTSAAAENGSEPRPGIGPVSRPQLNPKRPHVKCFNCGCEMPADQSKTLFENYKEFVLSNKPFILLISLTFDETFDAEKSCIYADDLLEGLNTRMFGVNYCEEDMNSLEGFAFVESHKRKTGTNNTHINILVKYDFCYDNFSFATIKDLFYEAASEVFDGTKKVFNDDSVFIQAVRDDDAIECCFKHMGDGMLSNVTLFGMIGMYCSDKRCFNS